MRASISSLLTIALLAAGGALWAAGQDGQAAAAEERMVINWFGINSRGVLAAGEHHYRAVRRRALQRGAGAVDRRRHLPGPSSGG